jgi:uncharacterized protein (DUF1330 family)
MNLSTMAAPAALAVGAAALCARRVALAPLASTLATSAAAGDAGVRGYVLVNNEVHNKEKYAEYIKLVTPTVAEFGGRYLVRGGAGDTMGDAWSWSRVVLMEFETVQKAKAWVTDPAVVPLHEMRKKYARSELVIFEGTVTAKI